MQKRKRNNTAGLVDTTPRRANYGEGGNQIAKKPSADNRP